MAVGIGVFLPPIGVCFFIACSIAKAPLMPAARAFLPYLAVLIAGLSGHYLRPRGHVGLAGARLRPMIS